MSELVIPKLASLRAASTKKAPAAKAKPVENAVGDDKPSFGDVPMECITASKTNPRKIFDDAALADLAASITKHGVAQPILLRPTHVDAGVTFFEVVAGERRFRASKLAGKTTVPAIVRNLSDAEALEIQVIENLQRQDLHPLEEAEGFEVLMRENGYTADVMAEKTGKSKAYIYASLKLCALEPVPRQAFYDGKLTKSTALLVARIPVKHLQEKCVGEITQEWNPYSTRKAAQHIEHNYMLDLKKVDFKTSDDSLYPEAGSCTACPKRTGNQPEVFADVSADVCTDPICFKSKAEAHVIRIKEIAYRSGQIVIDGAAAKKLMPDSYSRLGGGYVDLDRPNYADAENRTYREILGADAPIPELLDNPHKDEIIEVVKVSDIALLLKERGINCNLETGRESEDSRAREKEQETKAKIEREYRHTLFTQVHHASLMMNLVYEDLLLVAGLMFNQLGGGTIQKKMVMDLYGWTEEETLGYPDRAGKLRAAIAALSPAQLNQFIRDCALSHELFIYTYSSSSEDAPHALLAAAKRVKVDAYSIKAQINAAAKAKAKTKADAAKYAAAKKEQAAAKKAEKANKAELENIEQLTPEQVPAFLKAFPDRLNELTEFALESRPLFIALIEQWALETGHQYSGDGFVKLGTIAAGLATPLPESEGAASDEDEEDAEMLAEDIGLNVVNPAAEEPAAAAAAAAAEPAPQSATPAPRARKPKTAPAPEAWPWPKSPANGATTSTPDTPAVPQ